MNQRTTEQNNLNKVCFTLNTRAISAGRPQVYKSGGVGDTPSYTRFKREIKDILENDIGTQTIKRYSDILNQYTGLKVKIRCYYEVKNYNFWGQPMIKRPDLDNVAKALLDQVISQFGVDDGTIFDLHITKEYARDNKVDFEIEGVNVEPYKMLQIKRVTSNKPRKVIRSQKEKDEARNSLKERMKALENRMNNL